MTKLILELDDALARQLQQRADLLGTSIDQALRDALTTNQNVKSRTGWLNEFIQVAERSNANLSGWKWNRDELHER